MSPQPKSSLSDMVWFGKIVHLQTYSGGRGDQLFVPSTMVGSLKKNTTLEYSTRVVQGGDRRCEKSTLNDLAYLTPLRIPLMNPVLLCTG
jgi:hypothetical protein